MTLKEYDDKKINKEIKQIHEILHSRYKSLLFNKKMYNWEKKWIFFTLSNKFFDGFIVVFKLLNKNHAES